MACWQKPGRGHLTDALLLMVHCCADTAQHEPDFQLLCLQVRAMQIIDELEVNRRGPYGGGIGHVGFNGSMDMALALRTMIIPNPPSQGARADNGSSAAAANGSEGRPATPDRKDWVVHLQVGRRTSHTLLDADSMGALCPSVQCMASLSHHSGVQSTGNSCRMSTCSADPCTMHTTPSSLVCRLGQG